MIGPADHKMAAVFKSASYSPSIRARAAANDSALDNVDPIVDRIQALPQEVQEMILQETLRASLKIPHTTHGRVVTIEPAYKPPLALQLNKKHRELAARSFYSNTTFATDEYDLRTCAQWLSSLTPEHWQAVKSIKCSDPSKWNIVDHNDPIDLTHPNTARTTHDVEAAVDTIYEYSQEMLPSGAEEISLYHDIILVDLRFQQLDGSFVTRWYRDGCLEEEEL